MAQTPPDATPREDAPFPAGFVWGAATSAYQIEGAVGADGRGESIWDRFSHTPGRVAGGDTGDVACDHYGRWQEDVTLMGDLGLGAYRFSVAWPRVMPEGRGPVNEAGLDFYDRLVDGLLAAGIAPWATLYHWDVPQALEDAGGWPARETAEAFAAYADVVARRLGDRVGRWITLNEPWVSAFLGYGIGLHAPGRADRADALATAHHHLLAHGLAVPAVRAASPGAEVGITLNLNPAYPASEGTADVALARRVDGTLNRWFLDPLAGRGYPEDIARYYGADAPTPGPADLDRIAVPTDFLGVNYYQPAFVAAEGFPGPFGYAENPPAEAERTDMGWLVWPDGLLELLTRLRDDYPSLGPFVVTENGASYRDPEPAGGRVADPDRTRYLHAHLGACRRALGEGVPLAGYFAWSLLDNFEWSFGYGERFGLVRVDFETLERTVKDSGRWYAGVIGGNRLVEVPEGAP